MGSKKWFQEEEPEKLSSPPHRGGKKISGREKNKVKKLQ